MYLSIHSLGLDAETLRELLLCPTVRSYSSRLRYLEQNNLTLLSSNKLYGRLNIKLLNQEQASRVVVSRTWVRVTALRSLFLERECTNRFAIILHFISRSDCVLFGLQQEQRRKSTRISERTQVYPSPYWRFERASIIQADRSRAQPSRHHDQRRTWINGCTRLRRTHHAQWRSRHMTNLQT